MNSAMTFGIRKLHCVPKKWRQT